MGEQAKTWNCRSRSLWLVLVASLGAGLLGCAPSSTIFPPARVGDLLGRPIGTIKEGFECWSARPITNGKNYALEMMRTNDEMYVMLLRTRSWRVEEADRIVAIQDLSGEYRKDYVFNFFCRRKDAFDRLDKILFGMMKEVPSSGCHQPEAAWSADLEGETILSVPAEAVECCHVEEVPEK